MVNISIKSQPNRAFLIIFSFFSILVSLANNKRAPQTGQYTPITILSNGKSFNRNP